MKIRIYNTNPSLPFTRNIRRYKSKDFGSSDPFVNLIVHDDNIELGKKLGIFCLVKAHINDECFKSS